MNTALARRARVFVATSVVTIALSGVLSGCANCGQSESHEEPSGNAVGPVSSTSNVPPSVRQNLPLPGEEGGTILAPHLPVNDLQRHGSPLGR